MVVRRSQGPKELSLRSAQISSRPFNPWRATPSLLAVGLSATLCCSWLPCLTTDHWTWTPLSTETQTQRCRGGLTLTHQAEPVASSVSHAACTRRRCLLLVLLVDSPFIHLSEYFSISKNSFRGRSAIVTWLPRSLSARTTFYSTELTRAGVTQDVAFLFISRRD